MRHSVSQALGAQARLYKKAGWVALFVSQGGTDTKVNIPAYGQHSLGTVPDGWRPAQLVAAPVAINAPASGAAAYVVVKPDGGAAIQNWADKAISTDFTGFLMWPLI